MNGYFFSKNYWQAILLLVQTSIAKQNKNSILGGLWGLIQPFIHIIVITFFFSFLLRVEPKLMVSNLVGGLAVWSFILSGITVASNSLIYKEAILKRLLISRTYFPISDVLAQAYTLLYSFIAMYTAMVLYYPDLFSFNIIFVPILVIPTIISVMSAGIAVAFLTPYIRDIPSFVSVILNVLYWTVPIIYPYSMVPESKRIFFEFHPLFILIRPVQELVTLGQMPTFTLVIKSWIVCAVTSLISFLIYRKLARNVIYYL